MTLKRNPELLGTRSRDQSRLLEFRRGPLRLLSRRQLAFRGVQERPVRRAHRARSGALGDRLRRARGARRPHRQGAHSRPGCPRSFSGLVFNTRRPIFADIRVREAIGAAVRLRMGQPQFLLRSLPAHRELFRRLRARPRAAGRPTRASARCSRRFADAVRADVMDGTWPPPVTDGSGRDRDDAQARARPARRRRLRTRGTGAASSAQTGKPFTLRIPGHHHGPGAARDRCSRATSSAPASRCACASSTRCNTTGGASRYDFDMIEYRWDQSLSPGNEQAFYWGSAAADEQGTPQLHGREEPGDRRHDRGAAQGARARAISSPRCARSTAC